MEMCVKSWAQAYHMKVRVFERDCTLAGPVRASRRMPRLPVRMRAAFSTTLDLRQVVVR